MSPVSGRVSNPSLAAMLRRPAVKPLVVSGLLAVGCLGVFWIADRIGASVTPKHPPATRDVASSEDSSTPPRAAKNDETRSASLLDGTPEISGGRSKKSALDAGHASVDSGAGAQKAFGKTASDRGAASQQSLTSDGSRSTLNLAVTMIALLGALIAVFVVLRRMMRNSRMAPSGKKTLVIRDALSLGPKRSVYVIKVDNRSLVVGLSGDQMTLLSEFSDDSEAPSAAAEPAAEPSEDAEAARPAPGALAAVYASLAAETVDVIETENQDVEPDPVEEPPPPPPRQKAPSAPERAQPTAPVAASRPLTQSEPTPPSRSQARAFPFDYVSPEDARASKRRVERVPPKFRHLLEKAAAASNGGRK